MKVEPQVHPLEEKPQDGGTDIHSKVEGPVDEFEIPRSPLHQDFQV